MDRPISMVGGVKLNRGEFSVYVIHGKGQAEMPDGPIKEHIRVYYDFLMGSDPDISINGRDVRRRVSSVKKLEFVSFNILGSAASGGYTYTLYKKNDGFATLIVESPFIVGELEEEEMYAGASDEEGTSEDDS